MQDFTTMAAFFKNSKNVAERLFSGELTEADCKRLPLGDSGFHMEARLGRMNARVYARVLLIETATDDAILAYDYNRDVIAV
jgi:hypothetical protein